MYDLGDILIQLRKKHGYTQSQVAARLGVAPTTVVSWEKNYREPNCQNFIDLSFLYNVPITYLLGIEKKQSISIGNLSDRQKDILINLVSEFTTPNRGSRVMSSRQINILESIMCEFYESAAEGNAK